MAKKKIIPKIYGVYQHQGREWVGKAYRFTKKYNIVYNGFRFIKIPVKQVIQWYERCPHSLKPVSYSEYCDRVKLTSYDEKIMPDTAIIVYQCECCKRMVSRTKWLLSHGSIK